MRFKRHTTKTKKKQQKNNTFVVRVILSFSGNNAQFMLYQNNAF